MYESPVLQKLDPQHPLHSHRAAAVEFIYRRSVRGISDYLSGHPGVVRCTFLRATSLESRNVLTDQMQPDGTLDWNVPAGPGRCSRSRKCLRASML